MGYRYIGQRNGSNHRLQVILQATPRNAIRSTSTHPKTSNLKPSSLYPAKNTLRSPEKSYPSLSVSLQDPYSEKGLTLLMQAIRQVSGPLPRPSYVVPFWVVYYNSLPKNHNKPKKELHWSPWVVCIYVLRV